jgi:hypothetical protein
MEGPSVRKARQRHRLEGRGISGDLANEGLRHTTFLEGDMPPVGRYRIRSDGAIGLGDG